MSTLLPEGTYRVKAVASGIGVSNSKSTPFTRVTFRVLDGPEQGQEIDWIAYVTPKTEERVALDFRTCGLPGNDLEVLHDRNEQEVAQLLPNAVSIVVQHEEFQGSLQARVRWVNPEKKETSSGSIFAGMKAAFAAVDSKAGAGARKPPAGAIPRPAATDPAPPPAPDMADDDVPF